MTTCDRPDLSMYSPDFRLFEEAREAWEYFVSDKFVYVGDLFNRQLDPVMNIAKQYADGAIRVECHFTFHGEWNAHFCAIAERFPFCDIHDGLRKLKINVAAGRRNPPVLVKNAHFIEAPKQMLLNGIRSIVRLKRIDDSNCICGYSPQILPKTLTPGGSNGVMNRKLCVVGERTTALPSQCENQLIQGRPETVKQIPGDKGQSVGNFHELKLQDIPLSLNVFLEGKQMRLTFNEIGVSLPQSVQVFLRPGGFQIGISQLHDEVKSHHGEERTATDYQER